MKRDLKRWCGDAFPGRAFPSFPPSMHDLGSATWNVLGIGLAVCLAARS